MENTELFNCVESDKNSFVLSKSITVFSHKCRCTQPDGWFCLFLCCGGLYHTQSMVWAQGRTKLFKQHILNHQDIIITQSEVIASFIIHSLMYLYNIHKLKYSYMVPISIHQTFLNRSVSLPL